MADNTEKDILVLQRDLARLEAVVTGSNSMVNLSIQALISTLTKTVEAVKETQQRVSDLEKVYVNANPEPVKH